MKSSTEQSISDRLVFLLGGSSSFSAVADEFVPTAGGRDAHILVCMSRPGPDRKKYVPDFILPWIERGVAPVATSNSPTCGRVKLPRHSDGGQVVNLGRSASFRSSCGSLLESPALSFEAQQVSVVHEPIQEWCDDDDVAKKACPVVKRSV